MKISAVDNMTPVEAAKTDKGRSMLIELLKGIENTDARNSEQNLSPLQLLQRFDLVLHSHSLLPYVL